MTTPHNRERYAIHYGDLEQYTDLCVRLRNIDRAPEFTESPTMKDNIDFNTKERKRARVTTEFEKSFYKLLNKSGFGKTMKNVCSLLRSLSSQQRS